MPNITHEYREGFEASAKADGAAARQEWMAPTVTRLEAGAAEVGPNPIRPEGLAQGS